MKNAIIILLAILVGVLIYYQFVKDDVLDTSSSNNSSSAETDKPEASSGETIDLSDKGLAEVPQDILDNSSIIVFDVSGNNLTGSLPAEIRKLTNLEELNASENKMTGIPAEIGQLSKLRVANFANNKISGLPLEIGSLDNLETLDLRGNPNVSKYDIEQIKQNIPNVMILTD